MKFYVDILSIPEERPRAPTTLAQYEIEAQSLEQARLAGLRRFESENPGKELTLVHGRARPSP